MILKRCVQGANLNYDTNRALSQDPSSNIRPYYLTFYSLPALLRCHKLINCYRGAIRPPGYIHTMTLNTFTTDFIESTALGSEGPRAELICAQIKCNLMLTFMQRAVCVACVKGSSVSRDARNHGVLSVSPANTTITHVDSYIVFITIAPSVIALHVSNEFEMYMSIVGN